MHFAARASFVGSLACATLAAQCQFSSLARKSIGPWCNTASTGACAIPSTPTMLTTTLDPTTCTLTVDVVAFQGCGASIPLRALMIGLQPAMVPLPDFGPTCVLQVAPFAVLATAGGSFPLPLTRHLVSPFTFYLQGFALSVPPAGANIETLSDGVKITLL